MVVFIGQRRSDVRMRNLSGSELHKKNDDDDDEQQELLEFDVQERCAPLP